MTERHPLPRTIRGGRPVFFDDPAVDKVLAMLLDLSSEVWALRERLAAVEAVARARGVVLADEIDRHEFSTEDAERLDAQRREFIAGLFRVLKVEAEKRGEEALDRDSAVPPRREPPNAGARIARSTSRPVPAPRRSGARRRAGAKPTAKKRKSARAPTRQRR